MSFDAGAVTATLDLDRSPFITSLSRARRDAANFARQRYEATLGVKGSAETAAELKGVDKEADALDGRDINIDVDKDGAASAHLGSLSEGFKGLASSIRATKTVLVAAAIPFAIAGLGAGVPTVLGLGASFAGLALNLGRAAAGFGLVAGAATGAAYVGLRAYGALLSRVVSDTREVYLATHQQTAAFIDQQKQQILNTRAAEAFNGEINEMILRFFKLEAAVGREVFPIFTRELQAWQSVFAGLIPVIARTAGTIAGIAAGFARWFRTAQGGQLLARTVGFINSSAIKAAATLSELAATGVMAFQPLIPLASKLQSQILLIVRAADRWTQSAEGQRRLTTIYRDLYNEARRLGPVLLDVGRGVFNVFAAIQQTGVANQASRGLAAIASGFERITRRGTESRHALNEFLNDTRQLMPFVGRAVMAFVAQIGRVAGAVIRARQEGHKLTILQSIFRGIQRAAKPLGDLLLGTFRGLGPLIAQLIPRLARFFKTFAGTTGPLQTFVRLISRALQIFNNLPGPVKTAVANLAALKLILGTLGVGAVVAPLGRFAGNMFLANRAARQLGAESSIFAVAGGLARIGAVLGAGIGLVALAGTLYLVYRRNKLVHDAVDGLVAKLRKGFAPEIKRAQGLLQNFGKGVAGQIDKLGNLIVDIFDLKAKQKKTIVVYGAEGGRLYGRGIRQEAKKADERGGPGYELGYRTMNAVLSGFRARATSGGAKSSGRGSLLQLLAAIFDPQVMTQFISNRIRGPIDGALHRAFKNVGWASLGKLVRDEIVGLFNFGGLQAFLTQWTNKHIVTPIGNAIKNFHWGELGKDAAQGIINGFLGVDIAAQLAKKIAGAIDWIKHKNDGHSPWGSTYKLGQDAARGFMEGFAQFKLAEGAQKKIRELTSALVKAPESREKGLLARIAHIKQSVTASAGGTRAIERRIAGILNDRRISGRQARYLADFAGYVPDQFRSSRRGSFERLQPQLKKLGYSMFEDLTFATNDRMRRFQAGSGTTHKGITKDEMREVMHETSDKQLKVIRAAAAQTAGMPEFLRFLDAAMAKGWGHHTNAKPNAV